MHESLEVHKLLLASVGAATIMPIVNCCNAVTPTRGN